jgi:hypothetical protein
VELSKYFFQLENNLAQRWLTSAHAEPSPSGSKIKFSTVWTGDFDTPVCKLYCLFLLMLPKKKVLLPTGVSKTTAQYSNCLWNVLSAEKSATNNYVIS